MREFFRELARGLFFLPSGWKTLRDRRLQLPAVLAALAVLNYVTAATAISVALSLAGFASGFDPIANPILFILMIVSWLYMRFSVVNDHFVSQIVREDIGESNVQMARKRFLMYFAVSIALFVLVLAWIVVVGPI